MNLWAPSLAYFIHGYTSFSHLYRMNPVQYLRPSLSLLTDSHPRLLTIRHLYTLVCSQLVARIRVVPVLALHPTLVLVLEEAQLLLRLLLRLVVVVLDLPALVVR